MRPFSSCSSVFVVLGASSLWLLDGKSSLLYAEANVLAWLVVGLLVVVAIILCASLACFCSSFTCFVSGSPSVDWVAGVDGSLRLLFLCSISIEPSLLVLDPRVQFLVLFSVCLLLFVTAMMFVFWR